MTTDSAHNYALAPNLLGQKFTASLPNEKWVADIIYTATDEGWLYLATLMDLYSRRVVGWAMSDSLHSKVVMNALKMAISNRPLVCYITLTGAANMPAMIIKRC